MLTSVDILAIFIRMLMNCSQFLSLRLLLIVVVFQTLASCC